MNTNNIDMRQAVAAMALTKLATTKGNKDQAVSVPAGEYRAAVKLEVTTQGGTVSDLFLMDLKRGEDYSQVVDMTIPWQAIAMASLARQNAQTRDVILRECLTNDLEPDAEIKDRVRELVTEVKGRANKECKGKTTAKITTI
jgi:hypothetical protein